VMVKTSRVIPRNVGMIKSIRRKKYDSMVG
jgi:hypothetical protein